MKIVFNEPPQISYDVDINNHTKDLEQGYASHMENKNGATVLCFKNVEDHIDGNGMSLLWMISGSGDFFLEGEKLSLKQGDALLFDDNKEHGFESDELCVAASFVVAENNNIEQMKEIIKSFNCHSVTAKSKFKN